MAALRSDTDCLHCPEDEVRVMLVDRRLLFLAALIEIVHAGCPKALIETITNSQQALTQALENEVDVLFCEARAMPINGPELAARLRASGNKIRVILLGEPDDQGLLLASLSCGAVGFFSKDMSPTELIDGLNAVLAGHFVVGRRFMAPFVSSLTARTPKVVTGSLDRLSPTERSILLMVGRAESTKTIAASRGISPKTVRNHLASIYRKLEVRNRSEAIIWCTRAGIADAG